MQRWTLPVIALFVAFLALTAWLSYQVAIRFFESNGMQMFENAYDENNYPPSPAEVDELLNEIESKDREIIDPSQGYYYIDLLARRAWNHPESGRDDLHQAISVSQDMYRDYDYLRPYLVRWMIYLYSAASLPSKVDLWHTEAIARDPASLEYVRYFQIATLISRDDIDGARSLLAEELGEGEPRPTAAGLAIAGYGLFGDQEKAKEYEQYVDKYGFIDDYFKHTYAAHLIESGRFSAARVIMDELDADPDNDPDDALRMALVTAGTYGLDSGETSANINLYLNLATRYEPTWEGVRSDLLTDLFRITRDPQYLVELKQFREHYQDDFMIAYSVANAAANCWEDRRLVPGEPVDEPIEPTDEVSWLLARPPSAWARDALDLADLDYQRQDAAITLATMLAWPDGRIGDEQTDLEEAVSLLRQALGDPAVADPVITQRAPDYEYFLVDKEVLAARQAYPWFDSAVNHAIIDYLNRQREYFKDIVPLEPLSYRDAANPGSPGTPELGTGNSSGQPSSE